MALPAILMGAMRSLGSLFGAEGAGASAAKAAAKPGKEMIFNPGKFNGPYADPKRAYTEASISQSKTPPPLPSDASNRAKVFQGHLKSIGDTFAKFAPAVAASVYMIDKFLDSTQIFTHALTGPIDTLKALAAPIEELVSASNPGVVKQFTLAIHDAYGVLGRELIPTMAAFTAVARRIGDAMAGLQPSIRPAYEAIERFVTSMGGSFADVMKDSAPMIQMVATQFATVVDLVGFHIKALSKAFHYLIGSTNALLNLLGAKGFDANATSLGAGTRSVKTTSAREISDDAIKYAISLGIGNQEPKKTPELTVLEKIEGWLSKIWDKLPNTPDAIKDIQQGKMPSSNGIAQLSPAFNLARTMMGRR